eukprot:1117201-Rhodomonas_salina.1
MPQKCLRNVSEMSQKCLRNVSEMSQKWLRAPALPLAALPLVALRALFLDTALLTFVLAAAALQQRAHARNRIRELENAWAVAAKQGCRAHPDEATHAKQHHHMQEAVRSEPEPEP